MSILNYIEKIKRENEGPRITAQEPRIGLKPGGIVEPGVTHYAKKERSLSLDKKIGQIISKYGKEARGISAGDLKKLVMTIYNSSSRFIDSKSTKGIKNYLPGLLEGFVEEEEIAEILSQEKKSFSHKNYQWKGMERKKGFFTEENLRHLPDKPDKPTKKTTTLEKIPKKKKPSVIISEKLDPFRIKGDIVAIKKGLKIDTHHSIKKALLNPDIPGIHFKAETLETLYPVKDALNRGKAGGFANSVMNIAETELEKIAKARNALIDETGRIIKGKEDEFARLQAKGTKIVRNYSKAQELFKVPYKASGAPGKASGVKNVKGLLNFEVFTPGDDGVLKGKLIGGHRKKSYAGQILGDPLAVKPFAEYTVADIEKAKKTVEAKIKELGGKNNVTKLLGSGTANTEQKTIINEILRMGSGLMRGAGRMLSPKEFFKLKNLVGPGAWAALGAFEVGAITYDTINRNTPLKIALGNNWVTGWAMPWTKKEAQIEKLEEGKISGSPAMKKYMEQVKLMAEYERGEKVLTGLKTRYGDQEQAKVLYENQQAKLDKINNDWVNLQETAMVERDGEMVPVTGGELEFKKAVSDMEGTWGAGEYIPEVEVGRYKTLIKNPLANEYGYVDVGDAPAWTKKVFGKAALQGHDPMFETTGIQPIFDLPPSQIAKATSTKQEDLIRPLKEKYGTSPLKGYHEIKRPLNLKGATTTPLDADTLQMYAENLRNIGFLEPRGELPQWYIDMVQKNEKWRQLFEQSPTGLHGARLATGGIANLTRTVAPDSGPMSQGLRSLYIDDMDY